jgi:hypothetical protein
VIGFDDVLKMIRDNPASWSGEDVADKENVHS